MHSTEQATRCVGCNQLIFILLSCGRENTQFITCTTNTSAINSGIFFSWCRLCFSSSFFLLFKQMHFRLTVCMYVMTSNETESILTNTKLNAIHMHVAHELPWQLAFYANEKMPLLNMLFCKQKEKMNITFAHSLSTNAFHWKRISMKETGSFSCIIMEEKKSNEKKCNTQDRIQFQILMWTKT